MNWIFNLLKQASQKKAEDTAEEQNKQVQSDMFNDVMDIDEKKLREDAEVQQAGIEDARGVDRNAEFDEVGAIMAYEQGELDDAETLELFSHLIKTGHAWSLQGSYERTAKALIEKGYLDDTGTLLIDLSELQQPEVVEDVDEAEPEYFNASKKSAIQKIAAYEQGDTQSETVENDYHLRISGLSDYNLAEILAEDATHDKQSATVNFNEEKEKQLKAVISDRSAAETKVFNLVKDHTLNDWKKAFDNMREWENKIATEEELRGKDWKKGDWRTNDKDFKAVSDEDKEKDMDGVGGEEKKGKVGKEASDVSDKLRKKVEKKVNEIVDELLDDKIIMEKDEAVDEHERLTDVLESPSHKDDTVELEKQEEELADYKKASKDCSTCHGKGRPERGSCPECGIYSSEVEKEADHLNLEQEVPTDLPAQEVKDLPEENIVPLDNPLEPTLEKPKEKVDDKITQKIDEKVEEKTEEIVEKIEEKIEEHADEMAEKVQVKVEEKIDEAFEAHHEELSDPLSPVVPEEKKDDEEKEEPKEDKPEEPEEDKKDYKKDDYKEDDTDEKKEDEEEEIPSTASKKDVLTKVAEIDSPWKVVKDEHGVESIARVAPRNTKVSKDDDENDKVSKDLN